MGDALAVTKVRSHCNWFFGYHYGIDETDIAFNSNYSWSTGTYSYTNPTGSPYSFEQTALHELGHALGLIHEDRTMATMNSSYPGGGPLGHSREWDPFGDDRQGARFLYPDGTIERDLAGSPLKRTGSGTSSLVSSPSTVQKGSYVTVEYSFSNLGSLVEKFNIGFYLSTNSTISTYDTLLGTNYGALEWPGSAGTFSRTLWIPTWTAPGTYYLGFFLDKDHTISEKKESNNFQEMPRTITIY